MEGKGERERSTLSGLSSSSGRGGLDGVEASGLADNL